MGLSGDPSHCFAYSGAFFSFGLVHNVECYGTSAQKWIFKDGMLINGFQNFCLGLHWPGSDPRDQFAMLEPCDGSPLQMWSYDHITKTIFMDNDAPPLCLATEVGPGPHGLKGYWFLQDYVGNDTQKFEYLPPIV